MALRRISVACALALALCLSACSNPAPKDTPAAPAGSSGATSAATPSVSAESKPSAAASGIAAPPSVDASVLAIADAGPPPRDLSGKTVLHCGDSMVGGAGGLTKALEAKFKARGAKFVHDSQVSAAISVYDKQPKLKELLARSKPDIVIITLGANEVFVPFPDSLIANVEGIVKRIAPRECYWTGPPTWKPDTGVVRVLREHVAPCKFFDSSDMKLERAGDGIHPTDKGGAAWAEAFWTFFESGAEQGEGKLLLPKATAK